MQDVDNGAMRVCEKRTGNAEGKENKNLTGKTEDISTANKHDTEKKRANQFDGEQESQRSIF